MNFNSKSSRRQHRQLSQRLGLISALIIVVIAAGGFGYYAYHQHHSTSAGGWTYLGTATDVATELGGHSSMATYACIAKTAGSTWTVKARAQLSPTPANPASYGFALSDWPYKSVTDVPVGMSESPIKQIQTSTWSDNRQATVELTIDPTTSNYIEVMATNKGYAGKILPAPVNELPSASHLANC